MSIKFSIGLILLISDFLVTGCGTDRNKINRDSDLADYQSSDWHDTLTNLSSGTTYLTGLDNEIDRFLNKWDIRGMSIAVTRGDSLLYTKGYGWADKEANIKMTPTTETRLASASKLLTAIGIMKLVEQKKIKLSSRVFGPKGILNDSTILSEIKDERIYDICVDDLLRHYGGFSNRMGDPMFRTLEIIKQNNLTTPPDREELIKIILGRKLGTKPGTQYKYSNFGYLVLSAVIEKVSGKTYWNFLKEDIFAPAGATAFHPATNYYKNKYPFEAKYYSPDNELVEEFNNSGREVERVYGGADIHSLEGGGGWIGSAPALARIVAAIDGDPGVKDILSLQSIMTMTEYHDKENLARGWVKVDSLNNWTRTGTLASSHVFIKRFNNGECWVLTTNTGVHLGNNFSKQMNALVESLQSKYSHSLPRKNLW